jgi:AcrR family transcriptional regulator
MDMTEDRLKILTKIIDFDCSKGHLRWKVSDLARATRIKRPLIYYHFGKTKKDILTTSVEMVAEVYFGLSQERIKMLRDGQAWQSLLLSREFFSKNPSFVIFYFRWRMTKSPMRDKLIEIERRYQTTLKKTFPDLSEAKILALHAVNQAVVTAPYLSAESLLEIHNLLAELWRV